MLENPASTVASGNKSLALQRRPNSFDGSRETKGDITDGWNAPPHAARAAREHGRTQLIRFVPIFAPVPALSLRHRAKAASELFSATTRPAIIQDLQQVLSGYFLHRSSQCQSADRVVEE